MTDEAANVPPADIPADAPAGEGAGPLPPLWDEAAIRAAVADARSAIAAGRPDLALPNAWAAAGAAVHLAAHLSDPDREDPLPPTASGGGMLNFAVSRGIVARPVYFAAVESLKVRDALADAAARGTDPPDRADLAAAAGAAADLAEDALLTLLEWPAPDDAAIPAGPAEARRAA